LHSGIAECIACGICLNGVRSAQFRVAEHTLKVIMSPTLDFNGLSALAELDARSRRAAGARSAKGRVALSAGFVEQSAHLVMRNFIICRKDGSFALTLQGANALAAAERNQLRLL
jgi:hypothetical protein